MATVKLVFLFLDFEIICVHVKVSECAFSGLNNKDGLLAQGQCESVSGQLMNCPHQTSAALTLNLICVDLLYVFLCLAALKHLVFCDELDMVAVNSADLNVSKCSWQTYIA